MLGQPCAPCSMQEHFLRATWTSLYSQPQMSLSISERITEVIRSSGMSADHLVMVMCDVCVARISGMLRLEQSKAFLSRSSSTCSER
jgi:hypothetical protein